MQQKATKSQKTSWDFFRAPQPSSLNPISECRSGRRWTRNEQVASSCFIDCKSSVPPDGGIKTEHLNAYLMTFRLYSRRETGSQHCWHSCMLSAIQKTTSEIAFKAGSLLCNWCKFHNILMAIVFRDLFNFKTPTSNYLQASGLDYLTAADEIKNAPNTAVGKEKKTSAQSTRTRWSSQTIIRLILLKMNILLISWLDSLRNGADYKTTSWWISSWWRNTSHIRNLHTQLHLKSMCSASSLTGQLSIWTGGFLLVHCWMTSPSLISDASAL